MLDSDGNEVLDYSHISQYKMSVHREILDLMYWSNGAFDWKTTYSEIPISLRRFYIKKLEEIIEKQNSDGKHEKAPQQSPPIPSGPFKPKGSSPPINKRNPPKRNK